jgi:hypothetical protein
VEPFLDIHYQSVNKYGEELCGDQGQVATTPNSSIFIVSDGLGSGVKASILATLTAEILRTMLRQGAQLRDVIDTVIRTLPVDRERRIAYATFTVLTVQNDTLDFEVINFDNPPPIFLRKGKVEPLPMKTEKILGKKITTSHGRLDLGDFIGLMSDGIHYAGLGMSTKFGWGWDNIGAHLEVIFSRPVYSVHSVVNNVVTTARRLYDWMPGDDATFLGVYVRPRNDLMVLTGPPLDNVFDYLYVNRILDFPGRKVICGGTTANIVADFLQTKVETVMDSMTATVPAYGKLHGIDLVTEGILTLAAAMDLLNESEGDLQKLTPAHNGAYFLVREFFLADKISFLVGQSINPFYQNPLLPKNISIRRHLIESLADILMRFHKTVEIEYC